MPKIHAHRPPTYDEGAPAAVEGPPLQPAVEGELHGVEASADGTAYEATSDEDVVSDHVEHPDYEALTVATLRGYLADRLLPTDGVKADLVARLQEDDARQDVEP